MEIKNRNNLNYRFTVDLKNPEDAELVASLREFIRQSNRWLTTPKRVCLKGRFGPADNPARAKYKLPVYSVLKEDAAYFDVYVYDRKS